MNKLDSHSWARLQELFGQLADATPAERDARLAQLQQSDPVIAAELRTLLAADADGELSDTMTRRMAGAIEELASEVETGAPQPAWIGDYRITGTLGAGGMGVVYLAEQESPRRTVALKVIRAFGGGTAVRRFQREAQLHGRLQHPGIALVHEAGLAAERDEQGLELGPPRPFFAMEYVRGQPVNVFVQAHTLDVPRRVQIMARICDAVEHAHSMGVIHRDLKSANVLVDEQGNPKVLDFGIARATDRDLMVTTFTELGEVIGTLPYMSPEQVSGTGRAVTPQTDIYALGVVLFEMLTGRRPLDLTGRSLPEAVRIVTNDEPTRLGSVDKSLRGDLDTIVGRCLEKDPARRYQSAGALAADLRRYLEHRPIEARPASALYQVRKFTMRHRPLVIGTATAFAALIAATVISITMAVRAENARADLAEQLRQTNTENTRSNYTYRFVEAMITSADPTVWGPNEITLRDYVRASAENLYAPEMANDQITGVLARMIGYTLYRIGDMDAAERTLRHSMKLLRMEDPHAWQPEERLIETLLALSDLLNARGKSAEAVALMNEAVATRERTMRRVALEKNPRDDPAQVEDWELAEPFFAVSVRTLGTSQFAAGQYAEAERTLRRANGLESAMARANWARKGSVANTMVAHAKALLALGRTQEALQELEAAVALQLEAGGPDAFATQSARTALGAALIDAGKTHESVTVLRDVCAKRRAHLPPLHYETALSELVLARALAAAGENDEALALATKANATLELAFEPMAPCVWQAKLVIAPMLDAAGRRTDARLVATDAWDAVGCSLGFEHPGAKQAAQLVQQFQEESK